MFEIKISRAARMRSTASSTLRIGRSGWGVPSSRLIPTAPIRMISDTLRAT
jgi:hypothetical protein